MTVNGTLTVSAVGLIDVTGRGLSGGLADPGAPINVQYGNGCGHGGVGGGANGGTTYGSVTNPLTGAATRYGFFPILRLLAHVARNQAT